MYANWRNLVSRETRLKFRKLKVEKVDGRYFICSSILEIEEGILLWAIFRFRIFSNYFSQKFEKK